MMIPVHHRFFTIGLVKKSTKIQIFVQLDRFFTIEFDDKFIIKNGFIINSKWLNLLEKCDLVILCSFEKTFSRRAAWMDRRRLTIIFSGDNNLYIFSYFIKKIIKYNKIKYL